MVLFESFLKRPFVYILTIKTTKKKYYKNKYHETCIKAIKSVWLLFMFPVIDKKGWSSRSSPGTPKFICPLPLGIAEINLTPLPLHAVVWGFAIKSQIHYCVGSGPRLRWGKPGGQRLRGQASQCQPCTCRGLRMRASSLASSNPGPM